jgi:hypothetical protein
VRFTSDTPGRPLSARETEAVETPAKLAMNSRVGGAEVELEVEVVMSMRYVSAFIELVIQPLKNQVSFILLSESFTKTSPLS